MVNVENHVLDQVTDMTPISVEEDEKVDTFSVGAKIRHVNVDDDDPPSTEKETIYGKDEESSYPEEYDIMPDIVEDSSSNSVDASQEEDEIKSYKVSLYDTEVEYVNCGLETISAKEDLYEEQSIGNEEEKTVEKSNSINSILFAEDFHIEDGSPAAVAVEKYSEAKVPKFKNAKYYVTNSVRKVGIRKPQKRFKSRYQHSNQPTTDDICLPDSDGRQVGIDFLSRKKNLRSTRKIQNRNVKGKIIAREHKLYTLSIAMMLGLRFAIYETHVQMKNLKEESRAWLNGSEFMHNEKYSFYPDGRKGTPPHKLGHMFKFKNYAPLPFAYIRRMFGIDEYEFIGSICASKSFIEFISNSKSGQFFFYSSDGKYMVKTMTNTESKFLRRILPHYFRHAAQNPNTLITKFLGMYRVKLTRFHRDVKFIIMNSVFDTDEIISSFYDLKGSSVGRNAKQGESVKKDNDVRKMIANDPTSAFILSPSTKAEMRQQVINDCNFLKEMNIFDYSMLIGVHYIPPPQEVQSSIRRKARFQEKRSNSSPSTMGSTISESSLSEDGNLKRKMRRNSLVDVVGRLSPSLDCTTDNERLKLNDFDIKFQDNEIKIVRNPHQYYEVTSSKKSSFRWKENYINEETLQNELIIEKSYWPFHRFYEVSGVFRKEPMDDIYRKEENDESDEEEKKVETKSRKVRCRSCLAYSVNDMEEVNAKKKKYPLKDFEEPLSSRDDGGFTMDATNLDLPIQIQTVGDGIKTCNGEIFYMGIIDILQQFNVRKRMEAGYKRFSGQRGASCVHPHSYADRFVRFFDEYTSIPPVV